MILVLFISHLGGRGGGGGGEPVTAHLFHMFSFIAGLDKCHDIVGFKKIYNSGKKNKKNRHGKIDTFGFQEQLALG